MSDIILGAIASLAGFVIACFLFIPQRDEAQRQRDVLCGRALTHATAQDSIYIYRNHLCVEGK